MTHGPVPDTRPDTGPDTAPPNPNNPAAAVCLHAALTALLLVVMQQTGLSLVAAAGLAWLGGACGTVALLLASDAAAHHAARTAPATAPDL